MTQPVVREYQTAEDALEAANRWIADLTRRLYEAQGSLFGVKPDRGHPVPVQFAVRKPEPEPHANCPETLKPNWDHPPIVAGMEFE